MKKIKVLIVDDSNTSTLLLTNILNSAPDIDIVAYANNGKSALELTKKLKPDIITMDIFMPKMDGVGATRAIMQQCPTPIIIISSHTKGKENNYAFDALEAGALSIIPKPEVEKDYDSIKKILIDAVRTLADVHVIRRVIKLAAKPKFAYNNTLGAKILALGSSTGGPQALHCILSILPASFPIPIVISQHMTQGFLQGLINWLQQNCKLKISIAENNQILRPGNIYFAPDNAHLTIVNGGEPRAILDFSGEFNHVLPSIDLLFFSIAKFYSGEAIGGLLTGMGADGARGLLQMRKAGCVTFAQSEDSCVIYGMPKAAIDMEAAEFSIDLEQIPKFLAKLISKTKDNYE